jgi:hypothetical protein
MSTRQVTVPHPLGNGVVTGERTGERPRPDTPYRFALVEIPGAGVWSVPEEDIR